MKPYKIFISYSSKNRAVAKLIASSINNIFKGKIEIFFDRHSIKVGSKWKEVILEALKDYDAILTILSPETYNKPWIIAEFSAFWFQDKDIYIVKHGEFSLDDTFAIFSDYQICDLQDYEDVLELIEVFSKQSNIEFIPYQETKLLFSSVNNEIKAIEENKEISFVINNIQTNITKGEINEIASKISTNPKISQKNLSQSEIKELAKKIGLFKEWKTNPHLTYEDGDIAWYYEQEFPAYKVEAHFRSKVWVLEKADELKERIKDQGLLSHISRNIIGEIITVWKEFAYS